MLAADRLAAFDKVHGRHKVLNARVPVTLLKAVDRVAEELGCTRTAAVASLLNAGLEAFDKQQHRDRATNK